jgi:hypothetical protein
MVFSVSIIIKLQNTTNHLFLENLIIDSANNCNTINIYKDFELEGINKHIKKNNKIIITEFDIEDDVINFINFIKSIKQLEIEYIYDENNILYCTNKYLNELEKTQHNKKDIVDKINNNKNDKKYIELYKHLNQ